MRTDTSHQQTPPPAGADPAVGRTYVDAQGLRWRVKRRRPEAPGQYVVEAQVHGAAWARCTVGVLSGAELQARVGAGLRPGFEAKNGTRRDQ